MGTTSGVSGAGRRGHPGSPGTGQGSVGFPDMRHCRNKAREIACMSCTSCGGDLMLAIGQNIGCGCAGASSSLEIAGMDVNDDAGNLPFDELEGDA